MYLRNFIEDGSFTIFNLNFPPTFTLRFLRTSSKWIKKLFFNRSYLWTMNIVMRASDGSRQKWCHLMISNACLPEWNCVRVHCFSEPLGFGCLRARWTSADLTMGPNSWPESPKLSRNASSLLSNFSSLKMPVNILLHVEALKGMKLITF